MSKKKVENLLKGVAITGATVGGASVLGDANLAYAAELGEEEANAMAQGEMVLQVAREQTEQQLQTSIEAIEEEKDVEKAVEETERQMEEIDLQSESASTSLASEDSAIESTSESAAGSLASESSELDSQSTSASESAAAENASLSTALSEAEEEFVSESTSFSEEGLEDDYLEQLIGEIEKAKAEVEKAQNKAKEAGQYLNHDSKSNNYYGEGDKLANLLIKYAFYQEGYVGEILYSEWDSSNYHTNSVKVTYVDSTGATKHAYFDYVTVDKDGNALVSGFADSPDYGSQHDNPYVVDGIMVVKKTVAYTDNNGNKLTWEYTTETGADGREETVCHYFVNGQRIADNVEVTLHDDDTFTLSWSNAGPNAKVTEVHEENPYSYSYVAPDNTTYHDLSKYGNDLQEVNHKLEGFTRNSADSTIGVVEIDAQGNKTISTLVDSEGHTLNLGYKTEEHGFWFWATTETHSCLEINGRTYYFTNAQIIRNCDGTYTLIGKSDEDGGSSRSYKITLYTAASASTSSLNFNPQFVARTPDGTEVYRNYHGEIKNGNFGVKGYNYFTLDDFNKGRDDYHEQRSEVTSLSDSLSAIKSESTSLSESASESAVASESASESRLDSLSNSASASASASASRSESLSESASVSNSISTSLSDSISASLSDSTSTSLSDSTSTSLSDSTSTSLSDSTSTSLSDSTSTSLSDSTSTSLSDSTSTSLSDSTSTSLSDSTSTSLSDSTSTSLSDSTSTSLSESTSASESASRSAATSETPSNPNNGGTTPASASETNEDASSTTDFNEVDGNGNDRANRIGGGNTLDDVQVPLAVRLDDADLDDDSVVVKDEETPLAMDKSGLGGRVWWYWILIIISALTGKVAKDKRKSVIKETEDTDK